MPKVTTYPTHTTIVDTDIFIGVRDSDDNVVQMPADDVRTYMQAGGGGGGAPTDAQYVTLATNGTLTQERVLTAGDNVQLTDGGAGGNVTVSVPSVPWGDVTSAPTTLSGYGITDGVNSATARPANTALIGPVSGADAAPTFRRLRADDIPLAFPRPATHNLFAWSYDPIAAVNQVAISSGVVVLVRIPLPEDRTYTLSTIHAEVSTAGSVLTTAACGVYSNAGTLLRETASQTGVWTSTGNKAMALTSTVDVTGGPDVWIYTALLALGTTLPQFRRATSGAVSVVNQVAADGFRFAQTGGGNASLPASITIGSLSSSSLTYWMGVS